MSDLGKKLIKYTGSDEKPFLYPTDVLLLEILTSFASICGTTETSL